MSDRPAPVLFGYPIHELELIGDSYYHFENGDFVGEKIPDGFTVNDATSCQWVMEKIFNAEADLATEEQRVAAILANYERKKKRMAARADHLRARFMPEMEVYAKTQLDGKSKFIDTPFGRLAFRIKKGGLRVLDKAIALDFAKRCGHTAAIKTTEEFQISNLPDSETQELIEGLTGSAWAPDDEARKAFCVEPDSEAFSIKTGIKNA